MIIIKLCRGNLQTNLLYHSTASLCVCTHADRSGNGYNLKQFDPPQEGPLARQKFKSAGDVMNCQAIHYFCNPYQAGLGVLGVTIIQMSGKFHELLRKSIHL